MSLMLDTGSSLTWIPGSDCPRDQCQGNRYETKFSKTFRNYTISETATYNDGVINGHLVTDYVQSLQNHPSHPAALVNFVIVNQLENLPNLQNTGLLGLSPLQLNSTD